MTAEERPADNCPSPNPASRVKTTDEDSKPCRMQKLSSWYLKNPHQAEDVEIGVQSAIGKEGACKDLEIVVVSAAILTVLVCRLSTPPSPAIWDMIRKISPLAMLWIARERYVHTPWDRVCRLGLNFARLQA
ncbi:uncharacterized protein MELLADRAFT_106317 [Melampsora larici-populina 98AG31]|uniref:Uncharacterized protein n=1 Tax=Melampsora larici-populina (strain 98AG31 / pathotype 3-4-7) TaxID=747676 RepID=F4RKZ7_MELLP|nr:uncharacterized protein MELLADRAFT_106317 [Melampsora larici-populina 98AG31]EGG06811.1 hypothetical protein MELLADRAFT_106317 [Melampsora larici-populina 98AG31]